MCPPAGRRAAVCAAGIPSTSAPSTPSCPRLESGVPRLEAGKPTVTQAVSPGSQTMSTALGSSLHRFPNTPENGFLPWHESLHLSLSAWMGIVSVVSSFYLPRWPDY